MDGRIQLGWKIANLYAELHGRMQLTDPTDNPLCALSPLDARLGCKSWCTWGPGQGQLEATAGWEILGLGPSTTIQLLSDPVECRPPPSLAVTSESASTTGTTASDSGSGSDSDSSGATVDGASASASSGGGGGSGGGGCTMRTKSDVALMGGTVLDGGPRVLPTWEECCAACQAHASCTGWDWIGESKHCSGSPCCFLKDGAGFYEKDRPGAVISHPGL